MGTCFFSSGALHAKTCGVKNLLLKDYNITPYHPGKDLVKLALITLLLCLLL